MTPPKAIGRKNRPCTKSTVGFPGTLEITYSERKTPATDSNNAAAISSRLVKVICIPPKPNIAVRSAPPKASALVKDVAATIPDHTATSLTNADALGGADPTAQLEELK